MEKLHFSKFINAPKEKVWETMLGEATYKDWTGVFNPGSNFEGDWSEGSTIRFVGPNEEGGIDGMISRIKENRTYEFVSIEHVGMLHNGVEDFTSEEVKKWVPALENYTFVEKDGGTELSIDVEVNESYKSMFEEMWPKALERLKEITET